MKAQSGKVSAAFHWIIVGVFGLVTAGICLAQALQFNDNCGAFQHQAVAFATGSPTAKLISGVAGTTIYVCKIHINTTTAFASPSLTLYGGTGATCGTTNVTLGTFGTGPGAGANADIGDGYHTILPVPAIGANLCSVTTAASFANGTIEYVQK